jgi:diguanylate cyclase (GGDEF)-like protein/PAS domain S-box-containing protein
MVDRPVSGGPPQATRLLLVEDSMAEGDLIRDMLGRQGPGPFSVTHVQRLGAALPHLLAGEADVVLLDLNLPDTVGDLSGFEEVHRAAPSAPVIILTNVQSEQLAARAVRLGAQDYLIKREINETLLRRAIRYAVERKRAEEALRVSEERYALAVSGANDGLWDWDLASGRVYFSPRWKAILGYEPDEIGERIEEWLDRVHPEDLEALRCALEGHAAGSTRHFECEHRVYTRAGEILWVLSRGLAVRDVSGRAYRVAGSLTDITARKQAEARLVHDAFHDALTGLPNRALCLDRLEHALKQYRRDPEKVFGVLFFDLDRFKTINDSLGHSVGDLLLVEVARRLQRFLRPGDTVARLGGDEFAILLTDIGGMAGATHVAERIHELLAQPFSVGGHEVYTSASIGIAMCAEKYERPEELLRDADLAMYRAKQTGSGCCEVFDSDMYESAVALLKLETDLRRAVEREEFVIHYQPIVSLVTGRILGFEALLRWRHPERGLVLPDHFIPAAEETGLIVPIGWWALRTACSQTREWQRLFPVEPPVSISVNISGKLFLAPDMAARLLEILEASGLPPESLHLEITESAMMDHREAAVTELTRLRAAGVKLHIDDFGTGYSSLTYLQRFSYDSLKIDRSFVSGMHHEEEGTALVRAIVALGKMLNMNVIAEGVETPEQYHWLQAMACPEAQGFWFSRPLDRNAASLLLQARRPLAS